MIRAGLFLAGLCLPAAALAAPILSPVWQDGAVIQRDKPVVVEGTAAPGTTVSGSLGSAQASARAATDGTFALTFAALPASADPVTLSVRDSTGSATVADIVVGDVWLCSGQSNMAWTVAAGLNGFNNIGVSADPLLRMLTVPLDTAAQPVKAFGGKVAWEKASPETTGRFSAACYYMLRDLRKATGVPQGAVHSSWGGSQIRAWLTPEAGRVLYGAEQMALLDSYGKDPLAAVTVFAPSWEQWYRGASGGMEPWRNPEVLDWRPVPKISPWTAWGEGAPAAIGNVWFRRTIELTPEQAAAGGTLNIGIIDDLDATWVNGRPVGINHGWSTEREYRIPAGYLRAGANEVVFSANNSWGAGGMQSAADRLSFAVEGGERISLAEGWRYAETSVREIPPRAPWDANAGIGVMHNRMIAPIGRFAMKGAAWYQGESDVDLPGYPDRLRELFAGWRRQFGADMRVLVVQLANYGATASQPTESGWGALREDQRKAVAADANAALVASLDIGEPTDIHPANKVVLGQRLALAAQGKPMPMPLSAERSGNDVTVTFGGVEGSLESLSGAALAFELCGETQDTCRFAPGTASGNTVRLPANGRPVTRVRHAWADSPVVNTYDKRAIPVPGFEIAVSE